MGAMMAILRRTALRGVSVAALASILVFGSLPFGPSAYADGPNALFTGFVLPDVNGLPARVRAIAEDGTVCGSADIREQDPNLGLYAIAVVSGATKEGCPMPGGPLRFTLLYGHIDEGVIAGPRAILVPDSVTVVHLYVDHEADPPGE